MTFAELLDQYILTADCTARELAESAGISETMISRYRAGTRYPKDEQLQKLAAALALHTGDSEEDIFRALQSVCPSDEANTAALSEAFSHLVNEYHINMADLARSMSFDASYLSRIKSGQRRPPDMSSFVRGVSQYIASKYSVDAAEIETRLTGAVLDTHDYTADFLIELDKFDLNDYLKKVRFDEIKIPTVPISLVRGRTAAGIEAMKKAELDFYKATVLGKSKEPVWMYSDFPIEEFSKDAEFTKKVILGLALCIKKGLQIHVIHDLDRPFTEMITGLTAWIPLYMTGQIAPYYLPNYSHGVFHHFLRLSGVCAMEGDCIGENVANGRYRLMAGREDMAFVRKKTECLFDEARSLMDIYSGRDLKKVDHLLASGDFEQVPEDGNYPFLNISIYFQKGRAAVIRKRNAPEIAFVIHHPQLVNAITQATFL